MAGYFAQHVDDENNKISAKNREDRAEGFVKFRKADNAVVRLEDKKKQ
jgi:hypothetical protein